VGMNQLTMRTGQRFFISPEYGFSATRLARFCSLRNDLRFRFRDSVAFTNALEGDVFILP
jgi:hypothetical protein